MPQSIPKHLRSGKVRDLFIYEDELWLIASDRVSAYDVVLKTPIPEKGKILTQLSHFWFHKLAHICPHHVIGRDLPDHLRKSHESWKGRLLRCRRTQVIPMECIVRGYLAGSAWHEYSLYRTVGGHLLPEGLSPYQALPSPIFTPSKKVDHGHDEPLTENEARNLVGNELYNKLRDYSMSLYAEASEYLSQRSLILADTKFEFGLIDNQIIWIDEALTPDSSRYWDLKDYVVGKEPINYDKQTIRDYLKSLGNRWKNNPIELPEYVIKDTQERYITAWEKITGKPWGFESLEFEASGS